MRKSGVISITTSLFLGIAVVQKETADLVSDSRGEAASWEGHNFKNVKIYHLRSRAIHSDPFSYNYFYEFPFTAVIFRESGWTVDLVRARAERAAQIFSACGVQFANVKIVEADVRRDWLDGDYPVSSRQDWQNGKIATITQATPELERPITYFIRAFKDQVSAISIANRANEGTMPALGSVWLTTKLNQIHAYLNPDYETLAHELFHVLTNSQDHLNFRNLMASTWANLSPELTERQCESLRRGLYTRPTPKRRH